MGEARKFSNFGIQLFKLIKVILVKVIMLNDFSLVLGETSCREKKVKRARLFPKKSLVTSAGILEMNFGNVSTQVVSTPKDIRIIHYC